MANICFTELILTGPSVVIETLTCFTLQAIEADTDTEQEHGGTISIDSLSKEKLEDGSWEVSIISPWRAPLSNLEKWCRTHGCDITEGHAREGDSNYAVSFFGSSYPNESGQEVFMLSVVYYTNELEMEYNIGDYDHWVSCAIGIFKENGGTIDGVAVPVPVWIKTLFDYATSSDKRDLEEEIINGGFGLIGMSVLYETDPEKWMASMLLVYKNDNEVTFESIKREHDYAEDEAIKALLTFKRVK
jgi:hypothetical protein